jgi:hypothetical protein
LKGAYSSYFCVNGIPSFKGCGRQVKGGGIVPAPSILADMYELVLQSVANAATR